MPEKRPKNSFYEKGLLLLVNKFFHELSDKDSEYSLMHEGFERTFDVWAEKHIQDESVKEDVWHLVFKKLAIKHG